MKRGKEEKEKQRGARRRGEGKRKARKEEGRKQEEEVSSKEPEKWLQRKKNQKRPVPGQETRPRGRLQKGPIVRVTMRRVTRPEGVVGQRQTWWAEGQKSEGVK